MTDDLAQKYADLAHEAFKDISNLRLEMQAGFAEIDRRLNERIMSSDRVKEQLHALVLERERAEAAKKAVATHIQSTQAASEARLRRYTALMSILVAVGTILGSIAGHLLHH